MSRNLLEIPRLYEDDKPLTKELLDLAFNEVSTWGNIQVQNDQQMIRDIFRFGYTLDNDGNSNYTKSLEDRMEFPDIFSYFEDFVCLPAALNSSEVANYWVYSGTDSSADIVASEGGVLNISTNSASPANATVQFQSAIFSAFLKPIMEIYLRLNAVTSVKFEAGLKVDSNNYAVFRFDTTINANNLYIASKNNGLTEVQVDTDFDITASTYVKLRLEFVTPTEIAWFVNGTQVAQGTALIGNLQTGSVWKPYIFLENKASSARDMDVDYVRITQLRNF